MSGEGTWCVPPEQEYARQDGGSWFVHDPSDGRTWRVNEATVQMLEAVRDGWRPGAPPPPALQAYLPAAWPVEEQCRQLQRLAQQGLVVRGASPPPSYSPLGPTLEIHGWKDIRLELFRFPAVTGVLRPLLIRAALSSPWLLAAVVTAAVLMTGRGEVDLLRLAWQEFVRETPRWQSVAVQLGSILVLMLVHETGHAATLGAAGWRVVPVGLRLYWGVPQAYTNASAIAILPERRLRLAVLLGGVTLELLAWIGLSAWALRAGAAAPPFVLAAVVFGGPVSLVFSLVPLVRNDACYILQELTGIQNLMTRAEAATAHLLFPEIPGAPPAPWLPWLGLAHVVTVGSLIALAGVGIGEGIGAQGPGAAAGALAAGWYFTRTYRGVAAGVRAAGASDEPDRPAFLAPMHTSQESPAQ